MAESKVPITANTASDTVDSYPLEQELGINNVMPTSSWADWYGAGAANLPPGTVSIARDPLAPTQEEMVLMIRRDGMARALLSLLTLPIRAAFSEGKWIEPEGGAADETEFANQMWALPSNAGGMKVSGSMFLRQSLLALAHGFSAFEIVRTVAESGPLAGKVVIDKMGYRDPRTVTFLADEHGTYQGFRQRTSFAGKVIDVTIPKQDSWYFAANENENPMYGVSMFEPAFKHYQIKWKMYYIADLAAQFAAVPGRIGEVPLGASANQIRNFKKDIANFAFNTSMIAPPNFKVENFNGNSNFDFLKIIDHHNTQMAGSILARFLQGNDHAALIQNGNTDPSADMFIQLLEAVADELAESWSTRLMPQFIDMNFGSGQYPIFQFAPLTEANKATIAAIFEAVVVATTLNCTPEFVRQSEMYLTKHFGFDIDYDEIAKREEEMAKAQEELAAQQAAMGPPGINPDGTPAPGIPGNGAPTVPGTGTGGAPAKPNSNSSGYTNQYSTAGSPNRTVGTSYTDDLDDADKAILALSELTALAEAEEEIIPEASETW